MLCPYCNSPETKVTDKRDKLGHTRRRRECLKCCKRFTTYEYVELELNVVKKDGRREKFDRQKLLRGIEKAFEKRNKSSDDIKIIMSDIEMKIKGLAKEKEIQSSKIGQLVMSKLKKTDKVAYIRYASVYREFADIDDFKNVLNQF